MSKQIDIDERHNQWDVGTPSLRLKSILSTHALEFLSWEKQVGLV